MNVCVFCGSASGLNPVYAREAEKLALLLYQNNCTLVYGGGNVGLMGILADQMLLHGGKVIGVIPDFLMKREVGHKGITELEIVESMHERKKRMADLTDAFIALPGGMGTLDELAEILTWKQLGLTQASVGLLNIHHFFDALILQMETMVTEGFLKEANFDSLKIADNPLSMLTLLGVVKV